MKRFSVARNNFKISYMLAGTKYLIMAVDAGFFITRKSLNNTIKNVTISGIIEGFALEDKPGLVYITNIRF